MGPIWPMGLIEPIWPHVVVHGGCSITLYIYIYIHIDIYVCVGVGPISAHDVGLLVMMLHCGLRMLCNCVLYVIFVLNYCSLH
jgi:hypothetical protein